MWHAPAGRAAHAKGLGSSLWFLGCLHRSFGAAVVPRCIQSCIAGDITDISVIRRVVDGKDVVIRCVRVPCGAGPCGRMRGPPRRRCPWAHFLLPSVVFVPSARALIPCSCIGPRGHGARTIYSDALRSVVRACDDAKVGRIILVTRDVDGGRDASNAPPLGQKLGAMFRGAVNRDMRELEEFLGNVADVDFGRRALHPNSGDAKLRTSTVTVVRPYAFSGADTVEYRAEVTGDGTTCIKGCSYHTSKRAAAQFIVDKAVKKEYANAAVLLDTPGVTGCF